MNLTPFIQINVVRAKEMTEFLWQFLESESNARFTGVNVHVVIGFEACAYNFIIFF